jgi:hypothetical protein
MSPAEGKEDRLEKSTGIIGDAFSVQRRIQMSKASKFKYNFHEMDKF